MTYFYMLLNIGSFWKAFLRLCQNRLNCELLFFCFFMF